MKHLAQQLVQCAQQMDPTSDQMTTAVIVSEISSNSFPSNISEFSNANQTLSLPSKYSRTSCRFVELKNRKGLCLALSRPRFPTTSQLPRFTDEGLRPEENKGLRSGVSATQQESWKSYPAILTLVCVLSSGPYAPLIKMCCLYGLCRRFMPSPLEACQTHFLF